MVFGLAYRDFLHEWRLSLCLVLALAAILAPMLVLFGLKHGVVSTMRERLIEDPANRQVMPAASGRFDPAWFRQMAARPSVGFVLQQNTNGIASANWSDVSGNINDNGTNRAVIVSPPSGNRFYRLFKP